MMQALRVAGGRSRPVLRRQLKARAYIAPTNLYQQPTRVRMQAPPQRAIELAAPAPDMSMYWKAGQGLLSLGLVVAASSDDAQCASNDDKAAGDALAKLQTFLTDLTKTVPTSPEDLQARVNDFLASGQGGQISWGFMMGACSGFALKKVSKVGAVMLGCAFMAMQCASYYGYLDVNYKKLERDITDMLDINKDGKFDSKDVQVMYKKMMDVLEFSLPAGSGYAAGFLVGFRSG
ncbi:hypothetical protein SDRG_12507 [Saprolegnia diclina VS20]|uniref:EF-hand domain-containing protein n=1 Tax=Saprolegnia diclina (strain VS20) TaxID=1156394 RepID=T0Q8D2_SAPDV|nr:hypothetical protein SDRG_12507 [Saprolegnia diclina VS20]EQC29735.1 hypothetical protein SDRG_12507 [Saprolegnia diclina VS20]|eukprot:XP_008616801.1 hypothetical protein SDRG_12507 [Saprolegnia diclina VS20]